MIDKIDIVLDRWVSPAEQALVLKVNELVEFINMLLTRVSTSIPDKSGATVRLHHGSTAR